MFLLNKFRHSVIAAFLVTAGLFLMPAAHSDSTLSQYSNIVIADDSPAYVQAAARDLQLHLTKITGKEMPLVTGKANAGEGKHFYVGSGLWSEQDARVTKLGSEGYLMAQVADGLLLTGAGPNTLKTTGVGHAVSLFLEKYCGVRWLWPGAGGTVFPDKDATKIVIGNLDVSSEPALRRRKLWYAYDKYYTPQARDELDVWFQRTRQGDQLRANFGHAWASIIPAKTYFEAHPDWFALVDGKRVQVQLCTSTPALRDEFFKRLLELPGNQKLDILSVSANDGYGFCECPLCRAKGDINDAYWDFVNDIATRVSKARPELGVGTLAYTFSRKPPAKIGKLPSNVNLSMTAYSTQLLRPEGQADYDTFLAGWKTKGIKIVMREYWGAHYWLDLPVLYGPEIGREITQTYQAGMVGAYGECGKNFSTQAPNTYLLTHMLWEPESDPQHWLDEFYAAFGPAGDPVKKYFETYQNAVAKTWRERKYGGTYVETVASFPVMFSPEVIKQAGEHLTEADKLAGNDGALKERLAFLRVGYDYTALMAELLGLYDKLGRSGFPLEAFEWEATARASRKHLNSSSFSEGREFFQTRQKIPFTYTLAEKDAWLERAWELGQKRIALLNANRQNQALDEGLYAITLENKMREWQQTIGNFLGKSPDEIIPLEYTKPATKS